MRKEIFHWASIAGAEPEPVELIESSVGRKGLLTIGCQDPFWLDDKSAGIIVYDGSLLQRPLNPETKEERNLREQIYETKQKAIKASYEWHRLHSMHGPDCELAGCTGKARERTHGWRGSR